MYFIQVSVTCIHLFIFYKHTHIPSVPPEGEGLMYARGSVASRGMRVLSPKIEPPVCEEEGSTA